MISLFRKIRFNSIVNGRAGQYIRYSIGEIFLVVVGILIAVQINQWNQNRIVQQTITDYLPKIHSEAQQTREYLTWRLAANDTLLQKQRRTLELLSSNDYSTVEELNECIGSVATSWWITLNTPTLNEFERQNLFSKLENKKLKRHINYYSQISSANQLDNEYVQKQYANLIEPYFAEHINYSNSALEFYRKTLVHGGVETNFEELYQSLEFWNIATLKLETTINQDRLLKELSSVVDSLIFELEYEISESE